MTRKGIRLVVAITSVGTFAACTSMPTPSAGPPAGTSPVVEATVAATAPPPATEPTSSYFLFRFDVENRSRIGVVVSVASDTAAALPGFEPGQSGSITIPMLSPASTIGVEIQVGSCKVGASATYPRPTPFTLLILDGARSGEIVLSTRVGVSAAPIPLPSNSLLGCGG